MSAEFSIKRRRKRKKALSDRVTRTYRLAPDVAQKLDELPWGQSPAVLERALRTYFNMPDPMAAE